MAGCYDVGPDNMNKAWAYNNVKGICDAYMLGYYLPGQQRHGCLKDGANQWYFTVKLRDDVNDRSIGEAECMSGLQKEISGCAKGGDSVYTNWEYKYVVAVSLVYFRLVITVLTLMMMVGPMPIVEPVLMWTT